MKLRNISLVLTAALLIGCGSGSSNKQEENTSLDDDYCTTEFVSNDGQSSNSEGYYGNDVCFGTKRIVGKWKRLLPWSIEDEWEIVEFKSDGNIQYYDINGSLKFATSDLQKGYTEYSVNSDGTLLIYYNASVTSLYTLEFVSIYSADYPDYFKTIFTDENMEVGTTQVYENHTICKIKYDENMSCE